MYRKKSIWNDEMELKCLLIFKKLERESFKRGRQILMCKDLAEQEGVINKVGSINAKVSGFKSLAGYSKPSNVSVNSKRIFDENIHLSLDELKLNIGS